MIALVWFVGILCLVNLLWLVWHLADEPRFHWSCGRFYRVIERQMTGERFCGSPVWRLTHACPTCGDRYHTDVTYNALPI